MKKVRDYDVNEKFLMEYELAAIANAEEILNDAKALLERKSFARAYFLSVASIEETGKAYIAFSSRGRNLSNPGLKKKLQVLFEDHSQKISAAFVGWIYASSDSEIEKSLKTAVDLMTLLQQSRETSMYVDAKPDGSISMPSKVIRPIAARASVRTAEYFLHHTKGYVKNNLPETTSSFDDKLLCIRSEKLQELYKLKDFWVFLLVKLKTDASNYNYSKAIVTYYEAYFCKKKLFSTKKANK